MNLIDLDEFKDINEFLPTYKPITDIGRVHNLEIPKYLIVNNKTIKIPERLRRKQVHYLVDSNGQIVKACWINRSLGLFLNSQRKDLPIDVRYDQKNLAINSIDREIESLIKDEFLPNKSHYGYMGFVQSNENIPEDCIGITYNTWRNLCSKRRVWVNTEELAVIRYPNLGPNTTKKLKLLVIGSKSSDQNQHNQIGAKYPDLSLLLDEQSIIVNNNSCLFVNPKVLKDCFEGDSDGDLLYCSILKLGKPIIQNVDLRRVPGSSQEEILDQLWNKASRVSRVGLDSYLPKYLDNSGLIALATYSIWWDFFITMLDMLRNSTSPLDQLMKQAWDKVSHSGIKRLEFVMDMRKGEFSVSQILSLVQELYTKTNEIREAQNNGVWFAKIVTTSKIQDIPELIKTFPQLSDLGDYLTCRRNNG